MAIKLIACYKTNNVRIKKEHDSLTICVAEAMYSMEVLHKCFYWYSSEYRVTISKISGNEIQIALKPQGLKELTDDDLENIITKISRDLIDFKLRDIVQQETKTIRELIVAKAFANYGTQTNPQSAVTDPVGFNVEMI